MCAENAILFSCLRALFSPHTIEIGAGASTLVVNSMVCLVFPPLRLALPLVVRMPLRNVIRSNSFPPVSRSRAARRLPPWRTTPMKSLNVHLSPTQMASETLRPSPTGLRSAWWRERIASWYIQLQLSLWPWRKVEVALSIPVQNLPDFLEWAKPSELFVLLKQQQQ